MFLVLGQRVHFLESLLYLCLEIPAGHLPQRETARKFIGRNIFLSLAHIIGNVECLVNREFAVVEDCTGGGRFFSLALRTSPRKGCFTRTVVRISALPADKTITPFHLSKEFKALLIAGEELFKPFLINITFENPAHYQVIIAQR